MSDGARREGNSVERRWESFSVRPPTGTSRARDRVGVSRRRVALSCGLPEVIRRWLLHAAESENDDDFDMILLIDTPIQVGI